MTSNGQATDPQNVLFSALQDDIALMKDMKLNHYRFSISWPRILPTGRKSKSAGTSGVNHLFCFYCHLIISLSADEHINERGIKYYDNLINMLLENKITPIVTLYHWDLPQVGAKPSTAAVAAPCGLLVEL